MINHSDVSRNSEISLQCYLRTEEPKRGGDGLADDLGNDIFLGGIKFVPNFDEMGNHDQWYNLSGGAGKIQLGVLYQPRYGQPITIDDFELMTVIGKGSFGKVGRVKLLLATLISTYHRFCKSANATPLVSTLSKHYERHISSTETKSHIPSLNALCLLKLRVHSSSR